jgi:thiamine-monophosphate kinase
MERRVGEFELIRRLAGRVGTAGSASPVRVGIGDDAAVTSHRGLTATSVDAIVEGIHFRRDWSSPDRIAARALAVALSDLAAMAAEPGEAYVTLGVPPESDPGFLELLADGLADAADTHEVVLAGGDTVASPALFLAVTVVGYAPEDEQFLMRSGASAGDLVGVTGILGGAAAGLMLLESGGEIKPPGPAVRDALISRQLDPEPRIEAGRALRGSGVTALIDLSDGLAPDLGHVAASSGVAIELEASLVPVQTGVAAVAASAGADPLRLAIAGGEDYELAMTFPSGRRPAIEHALEAAGSGLTVVGEVVPGAGVRLTLDGSPLPLPAGFDHLN